MQAVLTLATAAIAIIGILYRFTDPGTNRVTRAGRVAIFGAVATAGLTIALSVLQERQKRDEQLAAERRRAEEAREERDRFASLLDRTNGVLREVRRGIYPVDRWLFAVDLSFRLPEGDSEADSLHAHLSRIADARAEEQLAQWRLARDTGQLHAARPERQVRARHSIVLSEKELEEALAASVSQQRQGDWNVCDASIAFEFVAEMPRQAQLVGTRTVAACTHPSDPADLPEVITYRLASRTFEVSTAFQPLQEKLVASGVVGSPFDLVGKRLLVRARIFPDGPHLTIRQLELRFGSPDLNLVLREEDLERAKAFDEDVAAFAFTCERVRAVASRRGNAASETPPVLASSVCSEEVIVDFLRLR
jgi:hypothetical protein